MAVHSRRQPYDGVVLCAPVTVPYERYSLHAAPWWIGTALRELIRVSGVGKDEIDGFCVSSFTLGPDSAVGLTQHFGLKPRWLDHIPMGGASGIVALRRAARAVQSGDASVVAVVAGDANCVTSFQDMLPAFSRFAQDASYPYGSGGPNASFALITDHYMRKFGAKREDFGAICVAQRFNALSNPNALMKKPLTLEQYMAGRPISDPVSLFDCVMPCAGAEAFLVMREEDALAARLPHARLLSTIERHNAFADDIVQYRGGWALDVDEMWTMASLKPDDIDVLETYDDYPVIVMMQFEDLGFCAKGEGPAFVRQHDLTVGGAFPQNTSGGQLSTGQAGAAGGHLGIVEALRQVTGLTLGAAVLNARRAVVSGFGMINYDRGLCSGAAIIEGVRA
ncbi:thiolase family protein [Methylocapsa sp. S129]|uniref:thiolase family protein n=1 Tax=Methylocapsa sp. S129 TaxID=1641869 RepID=UPI00131A810D|nr:thiolase family protein [Methylocapsa sp. S129]